MVLARDTKNLWPICCTSHQWLSKLFVVAKFTLCWLIREETAPTQQWMEEQGDVGQWKGNDGKDSEVEEALNQSVVYYMYVSYQMMGLYFLPDDDAARRFIQLLQPCFVEQGLSKGHLTALDTCTFQWIIPAIPVTMQFAPAWHWVGRNN